MAAIHDELSVRSIRETGRGDERRRFASAYSQRNFDRANETTKQPFREKVIDHFLKHHARKKMRLLSMPGVHWPFEHQLADAFQGSIQFVGLEWNWGTMELGIPWIPGERPFVFQNELRTGRMWEIRTTTARWLWIHGSSFLRGLQRKDKLGKRDRKRWANAYKKNTAIWLDINSTLGGDETLNCLRGVTSHCDMSVETVPFALTFVVGQEWNAHEFDATADGSIERRLPLITRAIEHNPWRKFVVIEHWMYQSEAGCHMAHIHGLLVKRSRT